MAWPVTGGTLESVILTGDVSKARWGTDGLLPTLDVLQAGLSVLVISKCDQRLKKTDEEYKQGSGVQSGRAQIIHGAVWDLSVRDRTDVNFPAIASTITILDMANHFGFGIGAQVHAYVFDVPYNAAMGQPGERPLVLEKITLIETGQ